MCYNQPRESQHIQFSRSEARLRAERQARRTVRLSLRPERSTELTPKAQAEELTSKRGRANSSIGIPVMKMNS